MTSRGLEGALFQELRDLGFDTAEAFQGGFRFETDWAGCYRANLCLRTATRIVLPVLDFTAKTNEELYKGVLRHDFTQYIDPDELLAIDATVKDSFTKDQRFLALKVKDAIVDQFRDKHGVRPSVDKNDPDLMVLVRMFRDRVSISVDTSGPALFKRGYRVRPVEAPVKEHVAAGLLKLAGYQPGTGLVDPMCGSGTFLIEAALLSLRIPSGANRELFGFQRLKNFDRKIWEEVVEQEMNQVLDQTEARFFGFDRDREAVQAAKANAAAAGVDEIVQIHRGQIDLQGPPTEVPGLLIVNPPYGERLERDLELMKDTYRDLGYSLKTRFKGWTAWVYTNQKDCSAMMGLKATARHLVMNGPIECQFLKYEIKA